MQLDMTLQVFQEIQWSYPISISSYISLHPASASPDQLYTAKLPGASRNPSAPAMEAGEPARPAVRLPRRARSRRPGEIRAGGDFPVAVANGTVSNERGRPYTIMTGGVDPDAGRPTMDATAEGAAGAEGLPAVPWFLASRRRLFLTLFLGSSPRPWPGSG